MKLILRAIDLKKGITYEAELGGLDGISFQNGPDNTYILEIRGEGPGVTFKDAGPTDLNPSRRAQK